MRIVRFILDSHRVRPQRVQLRLSAQLALCLQPPAKKKPSNSGFLLNPLLCLFSPRVVAQIKRDLLIKRKHGHYSAPCDITKSGTRKCSKKKKKSARARFTFGRFSVLMKKKKKKNLVKSRPTHFQSSKRGSTQLG